MKLSEWAHIAEVTGAVAIVASLIFVGLEVRENTQVTRLTMDRTIDQQSIALNLTVAQSADFADVLVRGELDRSSLSPADRARFDNYCLSRFGSYENIVGDFDAGFIADKEFQLWAEHFEFRFDRPGYRQFWIAHREVYFESFQQWGDARYGIEAD
jgi:hypothetical protein